MRNSYGLIEARAFPDPDVDLSGSPFFSRVSALGHDTWYKRGRTVFEWTRTCILAVSNTLWISGELEDLSILNHLAKGTHKTQQNRE